MRPALRLRPGNIDRVSFGLQPEGHNGDCGAGLQACWDHDRSTRRARLVDLANDRVIGVGVLENTEHFVRDRFSFVKMSQLAVLACEACLHAKPAEGPSKNGRAMWQRSVRSLLQNAECPRLVSEALPGRGKRF